MKLHAQYGQSLAELLILLSLLMPFLLLLPIIADMVESRQFSIIAGRHLAFEGALAKSLNPLADLTHATKVPVMHEYPDTTEKYFLFSDSVRPPFVQIKDTDYTQFQAELNNNFHKALNFLATPLKPAEKDFKVNSATTTRIIFPWNSDAISKIASLNDDVLENLKSAYQLTMYSDGWASQSASEVNSVTRPLLPVSLLPAKQVKQVLSLTSGILPWTSAWKKLDLGKVEAHRLPSNYLMRPDR